MYKVRQAAGEYPDNDVKAASIIQPRAAHASAPVGVKGGQLLKRTSVSSEVSLDAVGRQEEVVHFGQITPLLMSMWTMMAKLPIRTINGRVNRKLRRWSGCDLRSLVHIGASTGVVCSHSLGV